MMKFEFIFVETNGVTLHIAVAGPKEGPLVILLHGFPEFWYGWKHQIEPLVEAGFFVVVPDQRGYNVSDKAEEIEAYTLDILRDDIVGLIHYFQREKATIIGHDWGGAVAWHLASSQPKYVEMFIPINIPHPTVMKKASLLNPIQWVKSSYILFFQVPSLPEKILSANGFEKMSKLIKKTNRSDELTKEELEKYKAAWEQPGALTAMLNWYRAMRIGSLNQALNTKIVVPVRMIWGRSDRFLTMKLAKESMEMCIDGRFVLIDEATHWVHHEQSNIVNKLIASFLEERQ